MSILLGMSAIISQLRNALATEESRLEDDLNTSINRILATTTIQMNQVIADINQNLQYSRPKK